MARVPAQTTEPITGPAAWRGEDLTPPDYLYELGADEVAAIHALRDHLVARGLGLGQIGPDDVPIPGLETAVANWLDRLENGIGLGLLLLGALAASTALALNTDAPIFLLVLICLTVLAIFLSLAYIRTRSILAPMVMHGVFNGMSLAGYLVMQP